MNFDKAGLFMILLTIALLSNGVQTETRIDNTGVAINIIQDNDVIIFERIGRFIASANYGNMESLL